MEEQMTAIELVQDRLLGLYHDMRVLKEDYEHLEDVARDLKSAFDELADVNPLYNGLKFSPSKRYEISLADYQAV